MSQSENEEASDEGLRVEIRQERGKPATCYVWRDGLLVFAGQDFSATLNIG